jgi:hypothetical protein
MLLYLFLSGSLVLTSAFLKPSPPPPKKHEAPTPIETIFMKKTKSQEELALMAEIAKKDILFEDKVLDDAMNFHDSMTISEATTIALYIAIFYQVYSFKQKPPLKKRFSWYVFTISALVHFFRNVHSVY